MSIACSAWHRRAEVRCDRVPEELTPRPHGEQARDRVSRALGVFMLLGKAKRRLDRDAVSFRDRGAKWRRGDSNPGPREDRPQRLRAYSTDWGLQPLASGQPTSGQVF